MFATLDSTTFAEICTIFGVILLAAVVFLVSDFLIISNFVISYVVSRGILRFFLFFCNVLAASKREWFP